MKESLSGCELLITGVKTRRETFKGLVRGVRFLSQGEGKKSGLVDQRVQEVGLKPLTEKRGDAMLRVAKITERRALRFQIRGEVEFRTDHDYDQAFSLGLLWGSKTGERESG